MAYVNVETRSTKYRLLLAKHDRVISAAMLANPCDGLVIEGTATRPIFLIDFLNRSYIQRWGVI